MLTVPANNGDQGRGRTANLPIFRSGIIVRQIPFTSATCVAALIRIPMNVDERRRMRAKAISPGLGSFLGSSLWRRLLDGAACGTRFSNGSSVTYCVQCLTCCFVSVVDGRTRSHFALVSRSARMIEVGAGCAMRLVPSTERDTNGRVSGPPPFPRPGRLARRVVGVNGGACAIVAPMPRS